MGLIRPLGPGERCGTLTGSVAFGSCPPPFPPAAPGTRAQTSPGQSPGLRTVTELQPAQIWRVVVLNDPVNLMSYVVMVFKRVLGFDEARARRHMLAVHEQGRAVVWTGAREPAEAYAFALQQWHLTAVLESDEAS